MGLALRFRTVLCIRYNKNYNGIDPAVIEFVFPDDDGAVRFRVTASRAVW